jgi:hypothetical protein
MGIEQFLGRPVVQIGAVDAQRVQFSYVMSSDLKSSQHRYLHHEILTSFSTVM